MRGGGHYYNQATRALNEIGVATKHGSHSRDLAIVHLDEVYLPAKTVCWHLERGWSLAFHGRTWDDRIMLGPPDMTPGKAARACARLLTEQNRRQRQAIETAVGTRSAARS